MTQVALAWLLTKDPVAAPIVGTSNLDHLRDMISMCIVYDDPLSHYLPEAVNVKLEDEEIKYLEEKYTPKAKVGF